MVEVPDIACSPLSPGVKYAFSQWLLSLVNIEDEASCCMQHLTLKYAASGSSPLSPAPAASGPFLDQASPLSGVLLPKVGLFQPCQSLEARL